MNKEEFSDRVYAAEGSLYRVAKSILHNDEDCADAIQSGILRAWQKLETLREDAYFKTWLTRIVINECYQILREAKRQVLLEEYPGWDAQAISHAQDESEMMLEFVRLEEKYRMPIALHVIEGYSVKETGEILGLPEVNRRAAWRLWTMRKRGRHLRRRQHFLFAGRGIE